MLHSDTISFSGNPVNTNAVNLNLYHETTMAQVGAGTGTGQAPLNGNTRSSMTNAKWQNAYLYKSSGYSPWNTAATDAAYMQAPTSNLLNTVTYNPSNLVKWSYDDVSIEFKYNR